MTRNGFTLAELLVSLAILGVVAAFAIPKVLTGTTDRRYRAMAKEAAGVLAGAYSSYQMKKSPDTNTTFADLAPYINYLRRDTTVSVDREQTLDTLWCGETWMYCLQMHNGGMLWSASANHFGGTGTTNAFYVLFDPDGRVTDGTNNSPGKSVLFWVYYDGKIRSRGTAMANTVNVENATTYSYNPEPAYDPPWFAWD